MKYAALLATSTLVLSVGCSDGTDFATRPALYPPEGQTPPPPPPPPMDAATPPPADVVTPPPVDAGGPRFPENAPCVSGARHVRQFDDDGEEEGSERMNPGMACIACHRQQRDGPRFTAAGTVFYAPHEEDLCNGFSGDPPGSGRGMAYVEFLMGSTVVRRLPVNRAGNFMTEGALPFPSLNVRVVGPTGRTLEMGQPPPHGDCNACHTRQGVDTPGLGMSPGRITVPL